MVAFGSSCAIFPDATEPRWCVWLN